MKMIRLLLMIINGLIMVTINYPIILVSSYLFPEMGLKVSLFMDDAAQKMKGAPCYWKDVLNITFFNVAYMLTGAAVILGIIQLIQLR